MSLIIEESLICDGPGCGETFGIGMGETLSMLLRRAARGYGWYSRNGKDYCLECLTKGIPNMESREKAKGESRFSWLSMDSERIGITKENTE